MIEPLVPHIRRGFDSHIAVGWLLEVDLIADHYRADSSRKAVVPRA